MNTAGGQSGSAGTAGSDGFDGTTGRGGRGGSVVVRFDAARPDRVVPSVFDKTVVRLVAADTRGGPGSYAGPAGPPPLFVPTDPSTLFAAEIARGVPLVVAPD